MCPRGQGRDPPLVSGVSWCQAFLCCPFPAPHTHRPPRRQWVGGPAGPLVTDGEATARGGQVPAKGAQHPGPPKGGVWDLITEGVCCVW